MWRFIADLSAVISTGSAEKKIKTVPHSAKGISIIHIIETRTILRTISKQLSKTSIRTSLPKFTGSYKNKRVFGVFSGAISYCCCSNEYF